MASRNVVEVPADVIRWLAAARVPHAPQRAKPRRRRPPEVLVDDEVRGLLAACQGPAPIDARNRALVAILYRAGLRVDEAIHVRDVDLDAAAGTIRVLRGKGGYARTVGIDAGGIAYLSSWLEVRATFGLPSGRPLLCTKFGTTLTTAYVRRFLPALARKAGLAKRCHAHGLRHTHAAQLRAEGVDIGIISKQLGHRSITTTASYLDHIAPMAVVEAIRRRQW